MKPIKLYKFNKIIGSWDYIRTCDESTKHQWLEIFQSDEPSETFKLSKNKPK